MYIVLLGPPGAGKGTQAQRIAAATKLLHISTGDMFRENVKNETPLGKLANEYMSKGDLVPDEVTIKMLIERISRDDARAGAMFDGFPRNVVQAVALDNALAEQKAKVDFALLISVRDEELIAASAADGSAEIAAACITRRTTRRRPLAFVTLAAANSTSAKTTGQKS